MMTESFQHDIAPLIETPSLARESRSGLMLWLQKPLDEDVETLSWFIAENMKDLHVVREQIQMLLHLFEPRKNDHQRTA